MEIQIRIENIINQVQQLISICYPNERLPIKYLTIFSQSQKDFAYLKDSFIKLGEETKTNNGFRYNLKEPIYYKEESIDSIRVRKPDIHRKELGCVDLKYNKEDYQRYREIALEKGFDIILRRDYEMIELSSFDLNVYAYIVKDL